jgi:hypothetical protein
MGNIFHLFHGVLCGHANDFDYDRAALDLAKDYTLFLVLALAHPNIVPVHIVLALAHMVAAFSFAEKFVFGYTLMIALAHIVVVVMFMNGHMLLSEEVILLLVALILLLLVVL